MKIILEEELNYFLDNVSVIFLMPLGRTGSLFMQSLFDQHPEVIVPPFYQNIYDYRLNDVNTEMLNVEKIITYYIEANPGFFDVGSHIFGKTQNNGEHIEVTIDRDAFRNNARYLLHLMQENGRITNRRYVFLTLGLSLHLTITRELPQLKNIKYYFFHLHHLHLHEQEFEKFTHDFPDAKCIVMVRDLYKSFASLYALIDNNFKDYCVWLMVQKLYIAYLEKLKLNMKNILYVDLDNLHKNMHAILQEISNYLGISFQESLLYSTYLGYAWGGNSHSKRPYTHAKDFLEKNSYNLSILDRYIICLCFNQFIKEFSYPVYIPENHLFFMLLKKMFSNDFSYKAFIIRQHDFFKNKLKFENVLLKKMPLCVAKKIGFYYRVLLYPIFLVYAYLKTIYFFRNNGIKSGI